MVRRKVLRRQPSTGERRTITTVAAHESVDLDDRPLALVPTRDGKRLLVVMPYEVAVVGLPGLSLERSLESAAEVPSVTEAEDGVLWLGGRHLHTGSIFATTPRKVGSKLGGVVDRLARIRSGLLCGVGSHGEILWDMAKESVVHRRKTGERPTFGVIALGGRAVFADGQASAWVITPEHPSGYTQLRLRETSAVAVDTEGIVALGETGDGRCVLGARDGAIAWFTTNLRIAGERHPRGLSPRQATPLAIAGDGRWIYVLRPRGLLHRFLLAQPKVHPSDPDEPPPVLPEAEECRLKWPASALAIVERDGATELCLGGPQAEGLLGRLWRRDPATLEWRPLALGRRTLVAPAEAEPGDSRRGPDFTPTRTKIRGEPLSALRVDELLGGARDPGVWITTAHGALLDRPVTVAAAAEVMPGDTVILPAMIRAREGTARPALLLWPGIRDSEREPPEPLWLLWGDSPRGWIPLTTPKIREQGWSRPDLFPMQIALAGRPDVAGNRAELQRRWIDGDHFGELARECKRLLKVLW